MSSFQFVLVCMCPFVVGVCVAFSTNASARVTKFFGNLITFHGRVFVERNRKSVKKKVSYGG